MKHIFRTSLTAAAAAAFLTILLQTPAISQALSAEEKAKIKARNLAQINEQNARVISIYDRAGKVVKTVGPKGLYQQPVFSPDAKRIAVVPICLARGRVQTSSHRPPTSSSTMSIPAAAPASPPAEIVSRPSYP